MEMEFNEIMATPLNAGHPITDAHTWGFESRRQGTLPKRLVKNSNPKPHPFTGNQHFTNEVIENFTELECFQLYFTQFIVKLIKKETNSYAFSVIRSIKKRTHFTT